MFCVSLEWRGAFFVTGAACDLTGSGGGLNRTRVVVQVCIQVNCFIHVGSGV